MPTYNLMCSFTHYKLTDKKNFNWDFMDVYHNLKPKENEIFHPAVRLSVGNLLLENFTFCPYLFGQRNLSDKEDQELKTHFNVINHLCLGLWLVKDNAVNVAVFVAHRLEDDRVIMSRPLTLLTDHECENSDTYFSFSEMSLANRYLQKLRELHNFKKSENEVSTPLETGIEPAFINSILHKTVNRIVRCEMLLQHARMSSLLLLKISLYVPAFECLFNTSENELSHQVSERAAFYIRQKSSERKTIYETLKEAYSVRSKFLHGQAVKKEKKELIRISKNLDTLLREIFVKILMYDSKKFLADDEKLNGFFKDLLFN